MQPGEHFVPPELRPSISPYVPFLLPSPGQSENGFPYVSHFTLLLPLSRGQQKENCLSGNCLCINYYLFHDELCCESKGYVEGSLCEPSFR